MGMFDEVNVSCPNCNDIVTFQSKAGKCILNTYTIDSIPIVIANSIDGSEAHCNGCGETVVIHIDDTPPPQTIKMNLSIL